MSYNGVFDRSIDLKGNLNFHGIEKEIPIKIILIKKNNEFWGSCNFAINLDEFDIDRPSLLMIKISNNIEIETTLKLIGSNNE
ncbi:YceI family protein [Croceibacter atlanticus]|uniref:YceI family protein n=1 Tax=Croceibacter atlanticus TaxID=313588 RepID=UPI003D6CCE4C